MEIHLAARHDDDDDDDDDDDQSDLEELHINFPLKNNFLTNQTIFIRQ